MDNKDISIEAKIASDLYYDLLPITYEKKEKKREKKIKRGRKRDPPRLPFLY